MMNWQEYELRKLEIQKQNPSPEEYKKAIKEVAEELETEDE